MTVPDLDRDEFFISASDRSSVSLQKLTADRVTVLVSGHGKVKLSGDVEHQTAELSDWGSLISQDLICDHASFRVTGHASADIRVNDELNAYLAEAARLTYMGYPDVEKLGTGSLVRRRKKTSTTRGTEHG